MCVALEGFYPWLDESHPADSRQVQTCLDEIGTLADERSKERHDKVSKSRVFQRYSDLFAEYTFIFGIPMTPFQNSGCPI